MNFPDALAASSLAGALHAPIILSDPHTLSPEAQEEIQRLAAKTAILIGGTAALSTTVESQISGTVSSGNVLRFAGQTRYDTALAVYQQAQDMLSVQWSNNAIVATGSNFTDALSISPYAYATSSPIFLSDRTETDKGTTAALASGKFASAIIVGGTAVVPTQIDTYLSSRGVAVSRLAGETRYDTSVRIAQFVLKSFTTQPNDIVFATGTNFPDALSGSALAGTHRTALLLVADKNSPTLTFAQQQIPQPQHLYVLGGKSAVASSVVNSLSMRYGLGEVEPNPNEYVPDADAVTPGAFCKKQDVWKKGHTVTGVIMICSPDADGQRYRWREYTGW